MKTTAQSHTASRCQCWELNPHPCLWSPGASLHLPCPIPHSGRTARVPTCCLRAPNRTSTHLPGKGLITRKREQSLQTLNPTTLQGSKPPPQADPPVPHHVTCSAEPGSCTHSGAGTAQPHCARLTAAQNLLKRHLGQRASAKTR